MAKVKDYKSIGTLIRRSEDGSTIEKVTEDEMDEVVGVMENCSTDKQWVQNVGTTTDLIMAPGSTKKITVRDLEAGVPTEIKGTGVKMKKYDSGKHDRPDPMTGGTPGLVPVDARKSLPADHPARLQMAKQERMAERLGKPLCGKGTPDEVRRIADEARELAKEAE